MAAKERAIRRPLFVLGRRRTAILCPVLSRSALVSARAGRRRQPAQLPAPWGGHVAPPAPILGLNDARPLLPLEFSRAWLEKVESVRQRREELGAQRPAGRHDAGELLAEGRRAERPAADPGHPGPLRGRRASRSTRRTCTSGCSAEPRRHVSVRDYWREVSGGLLEVEGARAPWVTLSRPARHYLPAEQYGWSSFGRIVELREEVLAAVDG
jgi:hypothetical protein